LQGTVHACTCGHRPAFSDATKITYDAMHLYKKRMACDRKAKIRQPPQACVAAKQVK